MAFADFLKKFTFTDNTESEIANTNKIATDYSDGAIELKQAINSFSMNLDWRFASQAEMIETYREVANYHEVDFAVDDITNEMVSFGEDEKPIKINLSNLKELGVSDAVSTKIEKAYEKITNILDLNTTIHNRVKQFYIDGRLAYHKVIDSKSPKNGLLDIVELDARYITKLRTVKFNKETKTIDSIEETFLYNENVESEQNKKKQTKDQTSEIKEVLELNPNSVTYVTSGLTDPKTGYAISYLHKAVKPANQLRMMENALVIYRITRAPERRIFYISTNNLPKSKAEQYINNLKNSYRNRMSFDPENGSFKDQRHLTTMQEDYWLPRDANGKGTEITTLPGGANLGDIEDVIYFLKRLYKALNVPASRMESDSMVNFSRGSEINRDELKFSKFVSKLRKRFNMMFLDLLKTELILTKVVTAQDWKNIEQKIEFVYAQDLYLEEQKNSELMTDRLQLLQAFDPYVGKYVSNAYIRAEVLKQTEEEQKEQDTLIAKEKPNDQFMSELEKQISLENASNKEYV